MDAYTACFVSSVVLLAGCGAPAAGATTSGSDAGDARSDAGADEVGRPDGPGDARPAPVYATCGKPPYVTFHLRAGEIHVDGSTGALADATLGFDLCPGFAQTTDRNGDARASVQRGVAFTAVVRAPGHVTVMTGEELIPIDEAIDEERVIELLPLVGTSSGAVPGYSADAPSFAVVIQPDPTDPPCNETIEVKLSLGDHPEAKVHYTLPGWPSDTTEVIEGTSIGPVAFFTGIVGAEVTALQGTHPHCRVSVATSHQTGRFPMQPGVLTVGNVRL